MARAGGEKVGPDPLAVMAALDGLVDSMLEQVHSRSPQLLGAELRTGVVVLVVFWLLTCNCTEPMHSCC